MSASHDIDYVNLQKDENVITKVSLNFIHEYLLIFSLLHMVGLNVQNLLLFHYVIKYVAVRPFFFKIFIIIIRTQIVHNSGQDIYLSLSVTMPMQQQNRHDQLLWFAFSLKTMLLSFKF